MSEDEILKQAALKILNEYDSEHMLFKGHVSDMRVDVTSNDIYRIELIFYARGADLLNIDSVTNSSKVALIKVDE